MKKSKKTNLSIELNSHLCKAVLGKEYRKVHETMEGVRKSKKSCTE